MTQLGLNALPYTYVLDAHGAITYTQVGPVTSIQQLKGLVADHLGVQL
jgi:cytochrome c biogenesis protein CcmG, thiol:disulfide interchange protein DsbE